MEREAWAGERYPLPVDHKLAGLDATLAQFNEKLARIRSKMLESDGALSRVNEMLSSLDRKVAEGNAKLIEAGMQLSLKVGGSFVDIGPAGVSISGPMVMINSGGSAGSGSGSSPTDPKAPKNPDEADDGSKGTKMN